MGWRTPTGDYESGAGSDWGFNERAYDDDTATYASTYVGKQAWSKFLHLTHSELEVTKIRIWIQRRYAVWPAIVDVDIYSGGSWIDIYQGGYTRDTWNEWSFDQRGVTEMRMRFYNSDDSLARDGWIKEADFWESEQQPGGFAFLA